MALYLSLKETWRNRGRFFLFSLVISLITVLVLFIAALAGGLATANRQFIDKLEADMLVYQENVDLQTTSSRLGQDSLKAIRRVEGVADAGPMGFSNATVVSLSGVEPVDVSLMGVEPGRPGDPTLLSGRSMRSRSKEVIIDTQLIERAGIQLGDVITIRTIQGSEEEFYELEVVGITDERQYFFQPTILVSMETWEDVRPQSLNERSQNEPLSNVVAVRLVDPTRFSDVSNLLLTQVDGIEVADKETAILALPGYTAQQSTLNTQQIFTLLIGVLVVGGFFQIQTLQKVAQIGVLKAIGSPNRVVAIGVLLQIIAVTVVGVSLGVLGTLLLALSMPPSIPILFSGPSIITAVAALLLIGPIGGLVSIRLAVNIDPLTAIGLSS